MGFQKGSQQALEHMARIRAMKKGGSKPTKTTIGSVS